MEMTRRDLLVVGTISVVAAAMPFPAMGVVPTPDASLVADMFYTEDEPWGAFVRGHVSKEQFDKAILRMIDTDAIHRENSEDWLWESYYTEDENGDEYRDRIICGDPELLHMRLDHEDDDLGPQYRWCKPSDEGAIAVTVVRY